MNLVKWEPAMLHDTYWIDKMMNDFFPARWWGDGSAERPSWNPRTDVVEEKEAYRLAVDLPGVGKDALSVVVEEGILKISGERKSEKKEESEGFRRLERVAGSFERSFRLPEGVEVDKIESTFRDGVLTVRVPKSEKALPRQIEVKVR